MKKYSLMLFFISLMLSVSSQNISENPFALPEIKVDLSRDTVDVHHIVDRMEKVNNYSEGIYGYLEEVVGNDTINWVLYSDKIERLKKYSFFSESKYYNEKGRLIKCGHYYTRLRPRFEIGVWQIYSAEGKLMKKINYDNIVPFGWKNVWQAAKRKFNCNYNDVEIQVKGQWEDGWRVYYRNKETKKTIICDVDSKTGVFGKEIIPQISFK